MLILHVGPVHAAHLDVLELSLCQRARAPENAKCHQESQHKPAGAIPAQSALSLLPGCFVAVLKVLMATSEQSGLLPRAFLHNSCFCSSSKINRLFY